MTKRTPVVGILTSHINRYGRFRPVGTDAELVFLSLVGRKMPARVCVFAPGDINRSTRQINGYFFRKIDNETGCWERTILPLPDVVYDQIRNRDAERRHRESITFLKKETRGRYFNSRYLNKMMVHQMLQQLPEMAPYLPETRRFKTKNDLNDLLEKHESVYLKPVAGSLGQGIIKANRLAQGFSFQTRSGQVRYASNLSELYRKIKGLTSDRSYLVQQGLKLFRHQGRVVDIRVLIQKNGRGLWVITKAYVRVGPRRSITSNLASGGIAYPMATILGRVYNEEELADIRVQVRNLALMASEGIEKTSQELFGELGVDIGLDSDGHLWLIELNSKPRRTTRGQDQKRSVYLAFARPLRFACHLAGIGFTGPTNNSEIANPITENSLSIDD